MATQYEETAENLPLLAIYDASSTTFEDNVRCLAEAMTAGLRRTLRVGFAGADAIVAKTVALAPGLHVALTEAHHWSSGSSRSR